MRNHTGSADCDGEVVLLITRTKFRSNSSQLNEESQRGAMFLWCFDRGQLASNWGRRAGSAGLVVEVVRQVGVRAGNSFFNGSFVGHRQKSANSARDRILGHGRVGVVSQFVQAGVAVR